MQVGWIERRLRAGGRVFILVRRARDELWLLPGRSARKLSTRELKLNSLAPLGKWEGGPRGWDWKKLAELLTR
jgi:hypothetical protein